MTNTERVAYIRGLAEGLELDDSKKEVKVINAIIELLDDMALTLSDLEQQTGEMADQLDAVDEDLGALEDEVYDCGCDEDEDEEDCFYEVTCPNCNETICLSEDLIAEGEMDCPNCGERLEFDLDDLDDECEECGCGCNHDHE